MAGLGEDMAKEGRRGSPEDTHDGICEAINPNNGSNFQSHHDNEMDFKVLLHIGELNAASVCVSNCVCNMHTTLCRIKIFSTTCSLNYHPDLNLLWLDC